MARQFIDLKGTAALGVLLTDKVFGLKPLGAHRLGPEGPPELSWFGSERPSRFRLGLAVGLSRF